MYSTIVNRVAVSVPAAVPAASATGGALAAASPAWESTFGRCTVCTSLISMNVSRGNGNFNASGPAVMPSVPLLKRRYQPGFGGWAVVTATGWPIEAPRGAAGHTLCGGGSTRNGAARAVTRDGVR